MHQPTPSTGADPVRVWPQATLLAGILVASYLAGTRADLFEAFVTWSRRHEALQLDEIAVTLVLGSLGLLAMSLRAWTRAGAQTRALAQTSSSLAQVRDRMRHVMMASPVVIFVRRPENGRLVPAWTGGNLHALYGYHPEDVVSPEWWLERVHPDDRAGAAEVARRAAAEPGIHEFRFRTAAGDYR